MFDTPIIANLIGGQESTDPGLLWAQANAFVFHDYTRGTAVIGTAIQNSALGLNDISPNGITGLPANGALAGNYQLFDKPVYTFRDTGDDAINIGRTTALKAAHRGNFEYHCLVGIDDGQTAGSYNLFGVLSTGAGYVNAYIEGTGALGRFNIGYATNVGVNSVNWQTSIGVIPNGVTSKLHIRVRFELLGGAKTISVWINGASVSGSVSSGNLSIINPDLWDTAHDIFVGALNNAGIASSNTNNIDWMRFAITPLDPPQTFLDYFPITSVQVSDTLWQSQSHITLANAISTREAIIDLIFAEGTLPENAVPSTVQAVVSGSIHGILISLIIGYASITRLIFNRAGTNVRNRVYRIVNTSPNGSICLYCLGHSPINDILALNNLLANGYDILFCTMATSGDVEDLTDNTAVTTWTPINGGNHNEMSTLGVAGLSYHLYDKIEAINYIKANFSYAHIYMTGISGGGWMSLWIAALDERIEKSFPIRGWKPRIYKCNPNPTLSDFEQGGSNGTITGSGQPVYDFYTTYTYEDIAALCTTSGRLLYTITHVNDTALLGGDTFYTWKALREATAASLGGEDRCFVNTNPAEAAHLIYQDELDVIFTVI